MVDYKTNIIICECGSSEHQLLIRYFEDDIDAEVYVETHLAKKPLLDRIIYGIKYIFGHQSRFGGFDTVILGPQHINNLQSVIDHIKKVEGKKLQRNLFDGR